MTPIEIVIDSYYPALKWPRLLGEKLKKASKIDLMMTDNLYFPEADWPSDIVPYIQFHKDVQDLIAKQAGREAGTVSVADRNAALNVVHADLVNIKGMVYNLAVSKQLISKQIIESTGFDIELFTPSGEQKCGIFNTAVSGTILVKATGAGAQNWQLSQDMKAITQLEGTKKSKVEIPNLNVGETYYVRFKKQTTGKEVAKWSNWMMIVVT